MKEKNAKIGVNHAGYFSLLSSISSLLSLSSSSSLALCSLLKAAPCDWRIDACLLACLPACLLVGTSTGSWTKRELPLAPLSQLSAPRRTNERTSEHEGNRVSCRFLPSFPFPPVSHRLVSLPPSFPASHVAHPVPVRGRRTWKTLDTRILARSPISRSKKSRDTLAEEGRKIWGFLNGWIRR